MRHFRWLLVFFLLCIALRWGSFFISVINHDESTYVVIADELLRGEVYLKDVIDTKPIGIFLIYAALIKLTGGSIFALRVAASFVVALGAWGLYFAGKRATGTRQVGVAAGLIYCFTNSIFTYYGLSPNTEIFFNVLTIAAVALAVAPRIRPGTIDPFWHWPLAGFLLGLAMVIKPFAAAESLAVGLFLVWFYRKNISRMLLAGAALVAAYAVPLLILWLHYYRADMLETFYFYTFTVSGAYPIELAWYLRLKYMGDYLLRYSPFVILGAGTLVQWWRSKSDAGLRWLGYLLLQFITVTTVVLLTGKRFGHYQIQLHPIIALFGACWWASGVTVFPWLRKGFFRKWGVAILAILGLGLGTAHFIHYQKKTDRSRIIADYLNEKLEPGETYFAINGWQIAYHLTKRPVPTPYVHSSLLYLDHHVRAFQIDELAAAETILTDETVRYLIGRTKDDQANTPVTRRLLEEFEFLEDLPA
ncbi:MAG: glycosyltransferase family 39 protein, partial [Bacteroidota bacterium]